ncbi:MAG TPA: long-chain fatty acid--CoA ligase, partial [Calditrichia bacterium]|nr:long-chain fatty acid--CoA ligase [Calditrichia bacterium]
TAEKYPSKTGMMYKSEGNWQERNFSDMAVEVRQLAAGLAAMGVKKGHKVVIYGENSVEWALSDYAILTCGAATAAIYATLLPEQAAYICNDSGADIALVSNKIQFDKLMSVEKDLKSVKTYILFDATGIDHPNVMTYKALRDKGSEHLKANPGLIEQQLASLTRNDLAIMIYTSGTTGEPKGVMLSHGNLLSNIEAGLRSLPVSEKDVFLSFLPLSHIFERMVGHFLANFRGATIAYAQSIEAVPANLLEIRPTLMASVPRLFEKIYAKVLAGVEEGSAVKQKIFNWAVGVGREVTTYRQNNRPLPGGLSFKYKLATKLVFSKLQERVGGNIRFFVSGGAPLAKEIGEFFTAAGLLIIEGYGLSETSPVITVNRLDKFKFGTVGIALDNVEVKIAEDGEILTRGPHVMLGYYNKPEDTKEAIDEEGWFHTGDIGIFDEDGMLKITDRKKNIIVTAGGKNVAPQKVENLLVTSKYIDQVLVIGDKRKFCSALIVPSQEAVEKFAAEHGLDQSDFAKLCREESVRKVIQHEVDEANARLASYESIKKFILVPRMFSIETGELTPSLKIKRKVVESNYSGDIEALYN